jgi:hypothetical protein
MKTANRIALLMTAVIMILAINVPQLYAQAKALPAVHLNTDDLGPRTIEELTSKSIPRDYGLAWQTMAQALAQNRLDLLNGYFTGFAKDKLTKRVEDQRKSGVHVRYTDRGHKLTGLFYSPAGDAMQLRDEAQMDIQILDGDKVIHTEQVTLHYMVLMTPGADRWLVRDLQTTPDVKR